MAIILGIDPGSRFTGFGLIEAIGDRFTHRRHGVIQTIDQDSFAQRLVVLSESLAQLLDEEKPEHLVLEKIFLGKNADSAFKLGHARGVLMMEAARRRIPIFEYAARSIKKGVTGSGAASKDDVQIVVQNLLRIHGLQRVDASDALSMACYHAIQLRQQSFIRRAVEI